VTLGFHEPPLRMFPVDAAVTPNGRRNEITINFADPAPSPPASWPKNPAPR
jgi:glucose-6-phosphate 1-dehydrogenase